MVHVHVGSFDIHLSVLHTAEESHYGETPCSHTLIWSHLNVGVIFWLIICYDYIILTYSNPFGARTLASLSGSFVSSPCSSSSIEHPFMDLSILALCQQSCCS